MRKRSLEDILEQGEDLFSRGDIDKAAACFEEALKIDPHHIEVLNNLGVIAFHRGALEEAVSCLRKALRSNPNYLDAVENLAKCLEVKGEFSEAAELYRKRIDLGEPSTEILNSLGNCLVQTGQLDSAYKTYSESLEIQEDQPLIKSILKEMEAIGRTKKTKGPKKEVMTGSLSTAPYQKSGNLFKKESYRICILSFSDTERDEERRLRWGDYWIKYELQRAFEEMGHRITRSDPDVLIHLFGVPSDELPKDPYKILWIHSHPDLLCPDILARYDRIYSLSIPFLDKIRSWGFQADLLVGATAKVPVRTEIRHDIVFVGNTKGPYGRKIINDLGKTAYDLKVWGEGWENILPPEHYGGLYYENERLAELYAASRIVLNDHHEDMRREGFLNPRILDVFASGGFVISDDIQGIEGIFGETLVRYKDARDLKELVEYYISHPEERRKIIERGQKIVRDFTFRRMAGKILEDLDRVSSMKTKRQVKVIGADSRNRVSLTEEGERYLARDLLDQAQDCFERVLMQDAFSVPAAYGLARVFLKRGRRQEAITALKKCMTVDPCFDPAMVLLKRLLIESIGDRVEKKSPRANFTFVHAAWEEGNASFPEMTPAVITAFNAVSRANPELSFLICSRMSLQDYPWEVIDMVRSNRQIVFRTLGQKSIERHRKAVFVYPACSEQYRDKLRYVLSLGMPVITTAFLGRGIIRDGYNGLIIRSTHFQRGDESKPVVEVNDLAAKVFFLGKDPEFVLELRSNTIRERKRFEKISREAVQGHRVANRIIRP
ncbi:MAG TPA: tetratricopeptide repeat protein [Desulfobacteraceae bacterium]|nr:tetratricopeptide repeat protein [Desulfobacteraceae bacterium]